MISWRNNRFDNNSFQKRGSVWLVYLLLILEAWILIEPFLVKNYCSACGSLSTGLSLVTSFFCYVFLFFHYLMKRGVIQKIDLIVWTYVIFALVSSVLNHSDIGTTISAILLELKFVVLFLVLVKLHFSHKAVVLFFKVTVILISIQALLGFVQEIGGAPVKLFFMGGVLESKAEYRVAALLEQGITGTLLNKNIYGICVLFAFIIVLFDKNKLFNKKVKNILVWLLFIALILSLARAVWIAAFLLVIYIYRKHYLTYLVLFFGGFFIVFFLFFSGLSKDGDISKGSIVGGVAEITSSDYIDMVSEVGRIAYIMATYEAVKSSPVFGLGGGNWGNPLAYEDVENSDRPINLYGYNIPRGVLQDNNYASLAGQFGLVGLFLFLLILLYNFNQLYGYHHKVKAKDGEDHSTLLCSVCIALIFVMLITALTTSPFSSKPISYIFWSILGLSISHLKNRA